jgi:hypothetical protein
MNLEEQKRLEDKVATVLESLTRGEKAIIYKTLYAEGFKISAGAVQAIVRRRRAKRTQSSGTILSVFLESPRDAHTFPTRVVVLSFSTNAIIHSDLADSMFLFSCYQRIRLVAYSTPLMGKQWFHVTDVTEETLCATAQQSYCWGL